jgi:hypothetical protein
MGVSHVLVNSPYHHLVPVPHVLFLHGYMEDIMEWTKQHQDEYDALLAVASAAYELVDECKGGTLPPSLGTLAKLESALAIEWKIRTDPK